MRPNVSSPLSQKCFARENFILPNDTISCILVTMLLSPILRMAFLSILFFVICVMSSATSQSSHSNYVDSQSTSDREILATGDTRSLPSSTGRMEAIVQIHPKTQYWIDKLAKRIAPFFSMISLWGDKCWTAGSDQGTCFSRQECQSKGGTPQGFCAGGFGVCCVFFFSCNTVSPFNRTYFVNPEYPRGVEPRGSCKHSVVKLNGVCQIRLDFEVFELMPPSKHGQCLDDNFIIHGVDFTLPPLCGDLTGQHLYLPTSFSPEITFFMMVKPGVPWRKWKIRTTKINCCSSVTAPGGCVQYYKGITGRATSLNSRHGDESNIHKLNYGVCVRREKGFCAIQWTVCEHGKHKHKRSANLNSTAFEYHSDWTRPTTLLNNVEGEFPKTPGIKKIKLRKYKLRPKTTHRRKGNSDWTPGMIETQTHLCQQQLHNNTSWNVTGLPSICDDFIAVHKITGRNDTTFLMDHKAGKLTTPVDYKDTSSIENNQYNPSNGNSPFTDYSDDAEGDKDITSALRTQLVTKTKGAPVFPNVKIPLFKPGKHPTAPVINSSPTKIKYVVKPIKPPLGSGINKVSPPILKPLKISSPKPIKPAGNILKPIGIKYKPPPVRNPKPIVPPISAGKGCGKVIPFPIPLPIPIPIPIVPVVVVPFPFGGAAGHGWEDVKHEGKVLSAVEPFLLRVSTDNTMEEGLTSFCMDWEQIHCDSWMANHNDHSHEEL